MKFKVGDILLNKLTLVEIGIVLHIDPHMDAYSVRWNHSSEIFANSRAYVEIMCVKKPINYNKFWTKFNEND